MIQTHTISGPEAQQTIQRLQGITASQHFISYQINGTSVVASPNQQYRNDKIGQIEGCLKFFVDYMIFNDSIMNTFRDYYVQMARSYDQCEIHYKFWNDNIVSLIKNEEDTVKEAEIQIQLNIDRENSKVDRKTFSFNMDDIVQSFYDDRQAREFFDKQKKAAIEFAREKYTAIYTRQFSLLNIQVLKTLKQQLVNKYRVDLIAIKTAYNQYNIQFEKLDDLVNTIKEKLEPIFQGEDDQSLKRTLIANANQIVNLFISVGSLYIQTIHYLQGINSYKQQIDNNIKIKQLKIELEVAIVELPFLQAEYNCVKKIMIRQRLEYSRLKLKDLTVHIQANLVAVKKSMHNIQEGFNQIELSVNRRSLSVVTGVSRYNNQYSKTGSTYISYISDVTLVTQTPHLVDFKPRVVKYSAKTLKQKTHVKGLKVKMQELIYQMGRKERLEAELLQVKDELALITLQNLSDVEQKNKVIDSQKGQYIKLVQLMQVTDVSLLKIKRVTALLGIILNHTNVEKEQCCCGGKYTITKYTEINKSFAEVGFAKQIREVNNQPNRICTTHSERIQQTVDIKLLDSAKFVAQFELFGAYKTSKQDRQVIQNYVRIMDIEATLFKITLEIAQLFVHEFMGSIGLSCQRSSSFIQTYNQHYIQPNVAGTNSKKVQPV